MHFGEYELSPSLIGLSLLPSPHPEAFQASLGLAFASGACIVALTLAGHGNS